MSEVSQLKELVAPKIKEFPLSTGKIAKVGPMSIQQMLDIEEKYGDFQEWAARITDPAKVSISDVAEMMWGLCINKDEFVNKEGDEDSREMLKGFPAKVSWLKEVKIILLDVIKDSIDTEETVGDAKGN